MNVKPLLILPPLVLGIAGFLWMTSGAPKQVKEASEHALAVRVMEVTEQTVTPSTIAYGRVKAEHSWSALAELSGRVVSVLPGLAEGKMIRAGEVLVEIDATDYQIGLSKAEANLGAAQTQLAQLQREELNTQRSLALETSKLAIAEAEFERVQALVKRGASTETALDNTRRNLLAQQAATTNLTNALELYPTRRQTTEATIAIREAEVAEAKRALSKTRILAPFDGRVTKAAVELGQFARSGDVLVILDSVEASEITAEIQPRSLAGLIENALGEMQALDLQGVQDVPVALFEKAGVRAEVSYPHAEDLDPWPAEIVRFRGSRDSQTGAMGVVVRVTDPTRLSSEATRPPLTTGSFVAVRFSAAPRHNVLAVPRAALHQNDDGSALAYMVDADSRLEMRPVSLGDVVGPDVIVTSGMAPGDLLVLSDPRPPVPGLKLTPVREGSIVAGADLTEGDQ
ncbi:Multidrug resistance protein MdtA [Aliiroseovarius sp. xm-m-379]|uniref:efflux RND transporter periplasmic adaptor subunit n=1 Tax=unclassified Aliiroseovarius TaxID=2623558 RepID=UPI001568B5DE|nr:MULTISPECIES: HlyD family efflux transporter periplasmic adaptor subunit [unclassified Aliiroseovarius]NRP13921.1 Multidrug resistance protein MdtA [Aliiroseovarius sp. xm-d-517]NRP25434.1 Multidrug resistance protein MdtA [Aliiroseovarius sp. xm-m-379]NRP29426.1 Multidrug resistance protein MdtA [Aliiroseovarius sp. xm-m-314]NRP34233.1 Multidrug resistance protein MdtA [Aliiroseovarius sp. xm-a-104]NRP41808.1 Multidrug resistance protein MdtA [Aliiroseovarius sp. xm-m-339-2]